MLITSLENQQVKLWQKLQNKKYRDQYHLFIVEEKHLIQEALKRGCLDTLIVRDGVNNVFNADCIYVTDSIMKKISNHVSLNDYVGICKIEKDDIKSFNKIVVLENIQDPGNMGTIIRTAYCLGFDGVFVSNDCVDIYNEKTVASSQGSIFFLPIERKDIKDIYHLLKEKDVTVYATSLQEAISLKDVKKDDCFALVMGNEGNGLSQFCKDNADYNIKIEMTNFDSLNVAVAFAICAYQFNK